MHITHFICISGTAKTGKDTTASVIKEELENKGYSVLLTHYADLLKYICKNYFGWDGEKDETGRTLLQQVGTNCIRKQDPDYWVDFVANLIKMFPDKWDYVIVGDLRFPNELDRIYDAGFPATHVRVVRPNFDNGLTEAQKNHKSETALNGVVPDFLLKNTTISALREQVRRLCEDIIVKKNREEAV